jgi:hypothetical protein
VFDKNQAFSDPELTYTAKKDSSFIDFKEKTIPELIHHLKKQPIDNKMPVASIDRFAYNSLDNFTDGLLITIDQVSYIEVYLDAIHLDTTPKTVDLRYVLYDTYGLDDEDLKKYGLLANNEDGRAASPSKDSFKKKFVSTAFGSMFNAWWLLQYQHDCVPFVTKIEIPVYDISF